MPFFHPSLFLQCLALLTMRQQFSYGKSISLTSLPAWELSLVWFLYPLRLDSWLRYRTECNFWTFIYLFAHVNCQCTHQLTQYLVTGCYIICKNTLASNKTTDSYTWKSPKNNYLPQHWAISRCEESSRYADCESWFCNLLFQLQLCSGKVLTFF